MMGDPVEKVIRPLYSDLQKVLKVDDRFLGDLYSENLLDDDSFDQIKKISSERARARSLLDYMKSTFNLSFLKRFVQLLEDDITPKHRDAALRMKQAMEAYTDSDSE